MGEPGSCKEEGLVKIEFDFPQVKYAEMKHQ